MQTKPYDEPPAACTQCELASPKCDICHAVGPHCMKYHIVIYGGVGLCEWRRVATLQQVMTTITFANHQLSEYYSLVHMRKKWPKVRGLTTRLTVTDDLFRKAAGRAHQRRN